MAFPTKLKFQFEMWMSSGRAAAGAWLVLSYSRFLSRFPSLSFSFSVCVCPNIWCTSCACVVNFYWAAFEILLALKSNEIQLVVCLLLWLIRSPGMAKAWDGMWGMVEWNSLWVDGVGLYAIWVRVCVCVWRRPKRNKQLKNTRNCTGSHPIWNSYGSCSKGVVVVAAAADVERAQWHRQWTTERSRVHSTITHLVPYLEIIE